MAAAVGADSRIANVSRNQDLFKDARNLQERIHQTVNKLDDKIADCGAKLETINKQQTDIFDQIDKYFDAMVEKVNARREDLKNQYRAIEIKEKR